MGDPLFVIVDVQSEREGRNFSSDGPIGTGPYVVTSFTKERAELAANENYWDGDVPFKRVEVPAINDANTRAMALQSGDIDMAINIGPGEYSLFSDNKDYTVTEASSLRDVMARMSQKGELKDSNLRDALIAGIDRDSYAKNLLKDTFIAGKAPLPPSLDYGFKQLKDPNPYNPNAAKTLLEKSGWTDTNGDGLVDKNGQNLSLVLYTYTSRPELTLYAEAMQADYKKIGIDVQIKIVDYTMIDGLIALAGSTLDATIARNAIINAQQILLDENATIFLGYPKINMIGKSYLKGVHTSPSEYYVITKDLKKNK